MKKNTQKAFTLIELLIVIAIIGILAVALLPSVLGAPARARDAARKADLSTVTSALESYFSDNSKYPAEGCLDPAKAPGSDLAKYFSGAKVPADPLATNEFTVKDGTKCTGQYFYCPVTGVEAVNYILAAKMEIAGDANIDPSKIDCAAAPATVAGNTLNVATAGYVVVK